MIKLKDILAESSKAQLGKIITDKDAPSFMTEEQWEEKWSGKGIISEIDEYKKEILIEHLGGDAVKGLNNQQLEKIYENIFTKLKNKLSRKAKQTIQKIVLRFVEGINYQRSQPGLDELQNYMRTGKITPGDSEKIKKYFLKDARAYGWTFGALATAPFSLLWWPILGEICTLLWKKWGVKAIVPTKDNDYWKHSDAARYDKMDKTSWTRKVVRNIQKIKQKNGTLKKIFGPF